MPQLTLEQCLQGIRDIVDDSGATGDVTDKLETAPSKAKVASSHKPATTDPNGNYANCIVCNDWFLKKTRANDLKCDAQTLQLDYFIVDCNLTNH